MRDFFNERKSKVSDVDFEPLSVTKKGILPQLENVAKSNDGENRKLVKSGDFVINSRSDRKGSSGLSTIDGSVSLINIVLTPRNINPKYCHHLFRSHQFIEEYYRNGRGIVADLWTTRYSEMRNICIPIPPRPEQDQLVVFLDFKISKINKFIKEKKREIELLKELKQTEINRAVTQGINPNIPMKNSGIDWLGETPEHWEVKRIKNVLVEMGERSINGNEEPLSMSPKKGIVKSSDLSIPNMASSYMGGKIAHKNDLFSIKIAIPKSSEQHQIVEYIVSLELKINKAISAIESEISLVQEYKTSLISEVVTGKVDVRDVKIDTVFELETLDETEVDIETEEVIEE